MGLSDRLVPVCTDLLGRAFERKAFVVEHPRELVTPPIWGVVAFGCHPNRDTLPRIETAFAVAELERASKRVRDS